MLSKRTYFKFRYSSGYGDLSLDIQKEIINILDCERKIGLNVSNEKILFPRKSITAIVGVTNRIKEKSKCKECVNFERCNYRKGDEVCGA